MSIPEDLVLHGVRVLGFSATPRVAARYGLDVELVDTVLLDFEAVGWVRHLSFAGSSGWSLTDAGRVENERRLAAELDRAGARAAIRRAHAAFLPLNRRFAGTCTDWQIRPSYADPMAFNDHTDWRWDERVLQRLASLEGSLRRLCGELTESLARFDRYADLYSSALRKVESGKRAWVDAHDRDSLHLVWMQLHEDLLATLGIPRGSDT